ncbi:MAG: efflux RND transporter permease subunit, partial [Candidatus Acidiferrales bacterium]
ALRHRLFVMIVGGVILAITAWQFYVIPKGFLPPEDNTEIFVSTEAAQGISFASMRDHQQELNHIVMNDPNRKDFFSAMGDFTSSNAGIIFIHLKDRNDRPEIPSKTMLSLDRKFGGVPVLGGLLRSLTPIFAHHPTIEEVIEELRPKFASITGINAYMQNLPPIQVGGQLTKSQYQLTVQGPDIEDLYRQSNILLAKMIKLPGLQDVTSDLLIRNPQVNVNIDRDKASALGVSAAQIEDALYTAYGQRQISTIYAPNDEYWVVMELEDKYQADPAALSMLYVHSSSGALVPLNAVATLTNNLGPLTVTHLGQLPAVTLSFNLKPGVAIGDAVTEVNNLARNTLPATITTQFQGTAQAFMASLTGLGILLVMAILVIYIVLGILYESFIHPITILS